MTKSYFSITKGKTIMITTTTDLPNNAYLDSKLNEISIQEHVNLTEPVQVKVKRSYKKKNKPEKCIL